MALRGGTSPVKVGWKRERIDCQKVCLIIFASVLLRNEYRPKTAFTRCRHILKTVKNSTDRPPVHTKTAHFLPADFENGRF